LRSRLLSLGILADVDAGKTTLTERLLFAAGAIDEIGSVDAGTTQTDSLALERQRGITIRSAVASFGIGDVTINLLDTPGHPDFIAEVERVLSVLDGVVLVISAVEGVQPQTRVLMRALQRLKLPVLLFVNKIDRSGADPGRVLRAIAQRLTPAVISMGATSALGTRGAGFTPWGAADAAFGARLTEALAEHDENILASYVQDDAGVPYPRLRRELAAQTRRALVHPPRPRPRRQGNRDQRHRPRLRRRPLIRPSASRPRVTRRPAGAPVRSAHAGIGRRAGPPGRPGQAPGRPRPATSAWR